MTLLKVAALAAFATMAAAPAMAEVRLDQDAFFELAPSDSYLLSSSVTSGPTGQNLVQSFTAGMTGELALLNLQASYAAQGGNPPSFITLALFTGDATGASGPGAALVGQKTFSSNLFATSTQLSQGGGSLLDVSSMHLDVTAGQQYSFLLFTAPASGGQPTRLSFVIGGYQSDEDDNIISQTDNQYAGGSAAWISHADNSIQSLTNDRGFQTYVDVAPVPEPGEWAMMGAGLAIVGGLAKRRRKA